LKNRDTIIIYWELLKAMVSGPQIPSKLARVANVPYTRLEEYLEFLKSNGLVKLESAEGHENYSVTPRGMELLNLLDQGLRMLYPALE
jgi:predicted transcriptional regulator